MGNSSRGLIICPITEGAPLREGRRASVDYLDLGLTDATDGRMTALYQSSVGPIDPPTDWHYHDVESQLFYITKGWVEIAFEDGTLRRINAGSFAHIPGGMVHNEIDIAHETAGFEITVGGTKKTVQCDTPAGVSLDTLRRVD